MLKLCRKIKVNTSYVFCYSESSRTVFAWWEYNLPPLYVGFPLQVPVVCIWINKGNVSIVRSWCGDFPDILLNLDILQGSFKLCNWLSLRRLVSWINHLPPACWSTFWKSIFKHQVGYRFDILDSISSFFFISTYAIIYVLIHHIIFGFTFTS